MCRWWPAAESGVGWSLDDKVGTELIVYMHVSASPLALAGATGAFLALDDLSIRETWFTYEQRRSAASPDSLPDQEVKHRRTVFVPERGEAGDQLEEPESGRLVFYPMPRYNWGFVHGCSSQRAGDRPSSLAILVLLASTNLLQGWSPVQLLAQDMGLPGVDMVRIHIDKYFPITPAHPVE